MNLCRCAVYVALHTITHHDISARHDADNTQMRTRTCGLAPAVAALALVAGACGLTGNESLPTEFDETQGLMTAMINGVEFRASSSVAAKRQHDVLTVSGGLASRQSIVLTLYAIGDTTFRTLPRSFHLSSGTAYTVGVAQYSEPLTALAFAFWDTTGGYAVGTVTITVFDQSHVEGTFSFSGMRSVGGGGAGGGGVTVSDGAFFAKFK